MTSIHSYSSSSEGEAFPVNTGQFSNNGTDTGSVY